MPRKLADVPDSATPLRINFLISADRRSLFVARCRSENKSASQVIRDLIDEDLAKPERAAAIAKHLLAAAQGGDADAQAVLVRLRGVVQGVPA